MWALHLWRAYTSLKQIHHRSKTAKSSSSDVFIWYASFLVFHACSYLVNLSPITLGLAFLKSFVTLLFATSHFHSFFPLPCFLQLATRISSPQTAVITNSKPIRVLWSLVYNRLSLRFFTSLFFFNFLSCPVWNKFIFLTVVFNMLDPDLEL